MAGIYVQPHLRPCYVAVGVRKQVKALFHGWSNVSKVVEPSPMIGGHPGGTISYTVGVVELEGGGVTTVEPESIRFLDNIFRDYVWEEEKNE